MTDYDVLYYEEQERRKREEVAPHILHGKVKELQEEVRELRETLRQETVHLVDAQDKIEQLGREADWLAKRLRRWECSELQRVPHNGLCRTDHEDCIGCWRAYAKEAVKDASS